MIGYYISKENAEKLGLLNDPNINKNLQSTIIVLTENDLMENFENYDEENGIKQMKNIEFMNWYYKNYYDTFFEIYKEFRSDK